MAAAAPPAPSPGTEEPPGLPKRETREAVPRETAPREPAPEPAAPQERERVARESEPEPRPAPQRTQEPPAGVAAPATAEAPAPEWERMFAARAAQNPMPSGGSFGAATADTPARNLAKAFTRAILDRHQRGSNLGEPTHRQCRQRDGSHPGRRGAEHHQRGAAGQGRARSPEAADRQHAALSEERSLLAQRGGRRRRTRDAEARGDDLGEFGRTPTSSWASRRRGWIVPARRTSVTGGAASRRASRSSRAKRGVDELAVRVRQ